MTLVEPVDPAVKLKELTAGVVDMSVTPNRIFPVKADEKQLAARPVSMLMDAPRRARSRSGWRQLTRVARAERWMLRCPPTWRLRAAEARRHHAGGAARGELLAGADLHMMRRKIGVNFEIYGDISAGVESEDRDRGDA